ncbi:hypothetical protein V8E53_013346 [Lactarius tabidus]
MWHVTTIDPCEDKTEGLLQVIMDQLEPLVKEAINHKARWREGNGDTAKISTRSETLECRKLPKPPSNGLRVLYGSNARFSPWLSVGMCPSQCTTLHYIIDSPEVHDTHMASKRQSVQEKTEGRQEMGNFFMGTLTLTSSAKQNGKELPKVAGLLVTMEGIGLGEWAVTHLWSTIPRAVGECLTDSDEDGGSEVEEHFDSSCITAVFNTVRPGHCLPMGDLVTTWFGIASSHASNHDSSVVFPSQMENNNTPEIYATAVSVQHVNAPGRGHVLGHSFICVKRSSSSLRPGQLALQHFWLDARVVQCLVSLYPFLQCPQHLRAHVWAVEFDTCWLNLPSTFMTSLHLVLVSSVGCGV